MLPLAVLVITVVFVGAIYLSKNLGRPPRPTVIVGSASPVAAASAAVRVTIEPHVDESNGILTIGVGDAVDSHGVLFGVTSVLVPFNGSGSVAPRPRTGEVMVVNVQLHNSLPTGSDALTISSASNFELQDANGRVYQETSLPGAPKPPDGKIGPGETLNGGLAYDVPPGQSYQLLFKETLASKGEIIVDLGRR